VKVTEKLIAHVLETSGKEPEQISSGIAFYENIENTINKSKIEIAELRRKCNEHIKILDEKIKETRKQCDHPYFAVSHYSAYEDRYSECGICGETF
jgi:uncharacterized protein YktA (UPF0223 family)